MLVLFLKFWKLYFCQFASRTMSEIVPQSIVSFLFQTFLVVTFPFVSKHLGPEINWNSVICHRNQECLRKKSPQ